MNFLQTYEYYRYQLISDSMGNKDPDDKLKSELDDLFNYTNVYDTVKDFIEKSFRVLSKYRFDDVEDRLCEFFDEIPKFKPSVHFSISTKDKSLMFDPAKLNNDLYIMQSTERVMRDILFSLESKYSNIMSIDDYVDKHKPAFFISFSGLGNDANSTYNLYFLESLADRVVRRFKQLYDVTGVEFNTTREGRRYNPDIDVYDYDFKIYVK